MPVDASNPDFVSVHFRGGLESLLDASVNGKPDGMAAVDRDIKLEDGWRSSCKVDSFMRVVQAALDERRVAVAVAPGARPGMAHAKGAVFVAADSPEVVAEFERALAPVEVLSLPRPSYCDYGYERARNTECMVFAAADFFLLANNPGVLVSSHYSTFSEMAMNIRKGSGREQDELGGCGGKGREQEYYPPQSWSGAGRAVIIAVVVAVAVAAYVVQLFSGRDAPLHAMNERKGLTYASSEVRL